MIVRYIIVVFISVCQNGGFIGNTTKKDMHILENQSVRAIGNLPINDHTAQYFAEHNNLSPELLSTLSPSWKTYHDVMFNVVSLNKYAPTTKLSSFRQGSLSMAKSCKYHGKYRSAVWLFNPKITKQSPTHSSINEKKHAG